jgi:RHS repeat-associated protein
MTQTRHAPLLLAAALGLAAVLPAGAADATPVWRETTRTYDDTTSGAGLPASATIVNPSGPDLTTSFSWDTVGNLVSVTGPGGERAAASYRADRRIERMVGADQSAADASVSEFIYDASGRLVQGKSARSVSGTPGSYAGSDWAIATIAYTSWGRLASITDPAGDVTSFNYLDNDLLRWEDDPTGRRTRYEYSTYGAVYCIRQYAVGEAAPTWRAERRTTQDALGRDYRWWNGNQLTADCTANNGYDNRSNFDSYYRPVQNLFPDGSLDTMVLDAASNVETHISRAGETTAFTYDNSNRPVLETRSNTRSLYAYDLTGARTQAREDDNLNGSYSRWVNYGYDFAGRLTDENHRRDNGNLSFLVNYEYDTSGNRSAIIWPDGYTARYSYDGAGRLVSVCEDADGNGSCNQTLAAWEYDRLGRRIQAWYGGDDASSASSATAFYYEVDSDLARLEHEFELGQSGERTVTFSHSYDAAGRLSATHVDESGWTWSAGTTAFTRDYANDIETDANASLGQVDGWSDSGGSSASQTLSYDLNGNLIATSGRLTVHDSRNRLTAYSGNTYNASTGLPTGSSQTSTMRYDADGRRVSMTDSNGTDLGFIHAGDMEIADLDLEGGTYNGVLRRYIPGASTDERVAMITVNPATGATISREYYHANRLGSVIAMADETGAITAQYVYTPYGVESPYNASGNPFRYTGRRLDAQWGVYYYRARYYDPQLGRFLETDPAGYADSMNLYAYVGNNPLNATDPTGEETYQSGLPGTRILITSDTVRHIQQRHSPGGPARDTFAAPPARPIIGALGAIASSLPAIPEVSTRSGEPTGALIRYIPAAAGSNGQNAIKVVTMLVSTMSDPSKVANLEDTVSQDSENPTLLPSDEALLTMYPVTLGDEMLDTITDSYNQAMEPEGE